jgi:N-acetylneuraminic acid mutarotase
MTASMSRAMPVRMALTHTVLMYGVVAAALMLVACSDPPTDSSDPATAAPAATPSAHAAIADAAIADAVLAPAAAGTWRSRATMPSDRFNVAAAVVTDAQGRSTLYAIGGKNPGSTAPFGSGGLTTVQAYRSATNSWITRAPLPRPLQFTNGAVAINGKIYVSGGVAGYKNYRTELLVYDPAANSWTEKRPMPRPTYEGTSAAIDGKLYVLSSCHGQEDCWNVPSPDLSFYRYDPATEQWASLPIPPSHRVHANAVAGAIGGKFYVVGGHFDGENVLDIYDPATRQWSTGPAMGSKRESAAGGAVNGKLYVIAGYIPLPSAPYYRAVATTSVYDPATNQWQNLAPAPFEGGARGAGRVLAGGQVRIDVVGGPRPANHWQFTP